MASPGASRCSSEKMSPAYLRPYCSTAGGLRLKHSLNRQNNRTKIHKRKSKTDSWQLSFCFLFISLFLFAYSLSFVCVCVEYFCNYALCIVKCHASSIKHSKERPGTTVFTYKYLFSWRGKKKHKRFCGCSSVNRAAIWQETLQQNSKL